MRMVQQMRRIVPALGWVVLALALSANGAAAQDRQKVEIVPALGHTERVTSVAVSDDGSRIISGSNDKTVKLWDGASGALLRTFYGHAGPVTSVGVSGGSHIISGGADKTIRQWDAAT